MNKAIKERISALMDGELSEFDMADIDEFDPMFKAFKDMDMCNMGIA